MIWVEPIRLLACEFEVRTNSRAVRDAIGAVMARAQQHLPVVERGVVTVTWTGEEFRIGGDRLDEDFELSVPVAVETVFAHLHGRALAAMADHVRISAASGMHAGCSFLIVGPPGAGTTTLAVGLLLEGLEITGDGLALLRDGEAVAFPRKFHLREDSIGRIAKLRDIDPFAILLASPQEGRLVALDPLDFGKPWRIGAAAVSTIFFVEPNHGADSALRGIGKVDMLRRLLPYCARPLSDRRGWLADLCATVDRAETFVIELGELASAVAATTRVLR